jgi:hypothetical protein
VEGDTMRADAQHHDAPSGGSMEIRRVVTGYDERGAPTVVFDSLASAVVDLPPAVGASLVDLWRSDSLPLATVGNDDPTTGEFALMPSGSLFRVIDLAPGDHQPMWHTTASVDFIYVARGEATLLYGAESSPNELTLATGDTIVQRGIAHAWTNRGADVCRLVNVSVAATLPEGLRPS